MASYIPKHRHYLWLIIFQNTDLLSSLLAALANLYVQDCRLPVLTCSKHVQQSLPNQVDAFLGSGILLKHKLTVAHGV